MHCLQITHSTQSFIVTALHSFTALLSNRTPIEVVGSGERQAHRHVNATGVSAETLGSCFGYYALLAKR